MSLKETLANLDAEVKRPSGNEHTLNVSRFVIVKQGSTLKLTLPSYVKDETAQQVLKDLAESIFPDAIHWTIESVDVPMPESGINKLILSDSALP